MSAANVDSTEKTFVDCLHEIKLSYLDLNKPLRLRVERWVEKLSLSNNKNLTWKKHRNAYARLLLSMVVSKSLTEPFHQMPPEGPLPSFPTQLNHKFKALLGSHESSFWRELFNNIHDQKKVISRNNDEYDSQMADVIESRYEHRIEEILNKRPMSPSRPINREILTLTSLIKEQQSRIQLLEQQLRDERLQHELHIQKMQYAHRIELASLRDVSAFNSSVEKSRLAKSAIEEVRVAKEVDQRRDWPQEENQFVLSQSRGGNPSVHGWGNDSGINSSTSAQQYKYNPQLATTFHPDQFTAAMEETSDQSELQPAADIRPNNTSSSSSSSRMGNMTNNGFSSTGYLGQRPAVAFASVPLSQPPSQLGSSVNSNRIFIATDTSNRKPAVKESNSKDAFLSFLLSEQNTSDFQEVQPIERKQATKAMSDDDYMAYLENFQAEIRSMN